MSNQVLFLGIDGGQSSTEAIIGDASGCVLGRGTAGPCNHVSGDEAVGRFENAITGAITGACVEASIPVKEVSFRAACLGLSGGAEDKVAHVKRIVRTERLKVTHDAEIALWGALAGEPGIIIIAGTGSMAFGRNAAGKTARAGGWGYVFGDEGGAFDIVRQAVRAALAMEEGWGPATSLLPKLLAQTGAASANEMLHLFYTRAFPRSRVAKLASLVDGEAVLGDVIAAGVLAQAGQNLARYVDGVKRALFQGADTLVSYTGGVFESAQVRNAFVKAVEAQVQPPERSPAEGALLAAIQLT